ncbi:MAG: hypothetical protein QM773_13250 [Hyphomonadaceae bacterium]
MKHFGLALAFVLSLPVGADQIVENFTTRTNLTTTSPFAPTAIWNQALGVVEPSLLTSGYGTGGEPTFEFDIGDGSDGVFDASTYSRFGTVNGQTIHLDTSAHPTLQVTSFYLEPGWILEPTGTSPLLIKSQSTVKIEGQIWCHGEDGGDATATTAGLGGQGRCGGTGGGDGGGAAQSGSAGVSSSDGVGAGMAGTYGTGAAGGGGGGGGRNCGGDSTCTSVLPGDGANTSGGLHGTPIFDPYYLTLGGGAGGGGGGSGPAGQPGGGGGAGGGAVRIFAGGDVAIGSSTGTADGYILAHGGHGGNGFTAGGPGGGGGGGSIQVFSGGTAYFNNLVSGTAASQAGYGAGGTNTSSGYGGDGGEGRSWFTGIDYQSPNGSFYAPGEESPVNPGNFVTYSTSAQSVTTRVFDLQSSFPKIDSVTLSPIAATYSVEYRASSDGFTLDDTGWTTNLDSVQNKRYLRLRILVNNMSALSPVRLDSLTLSYTPKVVDDFNFKAAGCGRISNPKAQPPFDVVLILLFWISTLTYLKLKARKQETLTHRRLPG